MPMPLHCHYRNKKTGGVYFAFGLADNQTNAQAGQAMVLYRRDDEHPPKTYVREASEFLDKFERVLPQP